MNEVADPGMIQQLWDWGHNFVTSPVFFVSVGLFIVWMLVFRLGRFVKDVIVGIFGAIFGMINLDRWRRVFFNMFSLIAMVGGTAGAFAAKASLGDGNVKLEALYGGGIAFAWSIQVNGHRELSSSASGAMRISLGAAWTGAVRPIQRSTGAMPACGEVLTPSD